MDSIVNDKHENRLALYTHFGLRLLVGISIATFILSRNWESAINATFILILMLTPSFLKKKYSIYLPLELDLAIVGFIFLSLYLGSLGDFYEKFPWWDVVLHFQSGLLLGVIGFVMIYVLNERKSERLVMSPGFVSLFAVCFSLALSVLWEIYEYAVDSWFGFNMQETGLPDTMGDFIINGISAVIIALIGYVWMRRRQKIPFTPKILKKYSLEQQLEGDTKNFDKKDI